MTTKEQSQLDREVQEALQVRSMSAFERQAWLRATWGRLQEQAALLYADAPDDRPAAISFPTMAEKNAYDEARELEFALRHSPVARGRS